MSLGHSEVSFNHSCLKVPVNSLSQKPSPKYERCSSAKSSVVKKTPKKDYPLSNLYNNYKSVKSYLEFYESIPDYTELHHLSNEEFYSRLKSLKQTQKRFCGESEVLNSISVEESYKPFTYTYSQETTKNEKNKPEVCTCCSVCTPNKEYCCGYELYEKKKNTKTGSGTKPPKINVISDNENASDLFEGEVKKHSGYEADQESSNLQVGDKSSGKRKNDGEEYLLDNCSRRSRSLPISPGCECDTPEFCHRFSEMSFSGCHSRYGSGYCVFDNPKKSVLKESKKMKSRPIPITSRIPLFDKIMMEKEARRRIIHDQYSEELRSLVKPFSFTRREEERERRRMFCSNPELTTVKPPSVRFKAKPIPKNLFSNYAYERMREEEFYRALRKRVRAEEMLKSSSLPPSMALRERMKYRSKSLDYLDYRSPKKTWHKACTYRSTCKNIKKGIELDEKKKAAPQKRRLRPTWVSNNKRRMNSATDSSTEISPYESIVEPENRQKTRPHSAFSTTRNNLASVLRIETARKRLEKEMEEKLKENRMKNEAKFKARLVRMTPAWRALSFDKEEDLALRMAARKQEERIRKENHQRLMESMYGRVNSMPPLFHRQRYSASKIKTSITPVDFNGLCINHNHKSESFIKDLPKGEDCKRSHSFHEGINNNYKTSESGNSEDRSVKEKVYESNDAAQQSGE